MHCFLLITELTSFYSVRMNDSKFQKNSEFHQFDSFHHFVSFLLVTVEALAHPSFKDTSASPNFKVLETWKNTGIEQENDVSSCLLCIPLQGGLKQCTSYERLTWESNSGKNFFSSECI